MQRKEIDNTSINIDSNSDEEEYNYYNNEDKDEYFQTLDSHNIVETENEKINKSENFAKMSHMTFRNNCVNLKCTDNIQTLYFMKEKYKQLEDNYFDLENTRTKKCEELVDILNDKENEKKNLQNIIDVYEQRDLSNLDYFKLKGIESKIMKSLEMIKEKKYKLLAESNTKHLDKKICVICYERQIEVLIKPCNHLSVCGVCSQQVHSCPICREKIIIKEIVKFS